MSVKATLAAVRKLGLTCSRTPHGEYRINLPKARGGTEATAYYTTDAQDAVDTATMFLREYHVNDLPTSKGRDEHQQTL